ncbi:MAG: phosphocholine cytidylyltransferase family protein [Stagnimonas sp.]|nr:phosphocholine cytidylyltransferase family protein [Stagnimonas sp.]
MKAIIISAGQGTRLLPLTLEIPKCLVEVHGRTILDHQIAALRAAGIERIVVVGGYRVNQIAEHLAQSGRPDDVELMVNPFWSVSSSIGSVWAAREVLGGPFCLLNGDTIFDASVIRDALRDMRPGVNLLVERLVHAEQDDMRVEVAAHKVHAVGKDLPASRSSHRSLGVVLCPDADGGAYRAALAAVIGEENGHNAYHHAVIHKLAGTAGVTAIENHSGLWCEIDRPEDIEQWVQNHDGQSMRRQRR